MKHLDSDSLHIHSIQNVMSLYCRCIDTKKWKEFQELFIENATMIFQDEEGKHLYEFDGPEPLATSAEEAIGQALTLHHLHNPEINLLNESEATGIWSMEDRFYSPTNAPHPFFHGAGYYHVRFVHLANRWHISELVLVRLRL